MSNIQVQGPDGIEVFPAGTTDAQIDAFMREKYVNKQSEPIKVQGPDGRTVLFAAGTDDASIDSYMRELYANAEAEQSAQEQQDTNWLSKAFVASGGALEGVPVAGPLLRRGVEKGIAHTLGPMYGLSPEEAQTRIDEASDRARAANPVLDVGSQVAGSMAVLGPLATTTTGASALGITGKNFLTRGGKAALSGGAIAGADQAARDIASDGEISPQNLTGATALGGTIAGAIPVVGAGARIATKPIADKVGGYVRGAFSPAREAARRVSGSLDIDRTAGNVLDNADVTRTAPQFGQEVMNVDRGGETTRALARVAANQLPEARDKIADFVQARFEDQTKRIVNAVTSVAGTTVDDVGAVDALRIAARKANKPAYNRAYMNPNARMMWNDDLSDLMQSPAFREAVADVKKRSANRAAIEGAKAVKNPFVLNDDGSYALKEGMAPTLEFWDHVQRNLRSLGDTAKGKNDRSLATEIGQIRGRLLEVVDGLVPEFKTARQGAAAFFGAEDAIDAGRKFARSRRSLPEMKAAFLRMNAAEKDSLKVGFASELIDAAKATNNRSNAIRSIFHNEEMKEKILTVFGRQGARELEAFVRVEDAMDMIRGALGNSTTARQLIESGAIGVGTGWYTGDWTTGIVASAGSYAGIRGAKKINERVMREVVDLLVSTDPKAMDKAVKSASISPQYMAALDLVGQQLAVASRSGAIVAASE